MRSLVVVLAFIVVSGASGASAQSQRNTTSVGQTKPPSRDAAPPATSAPLDPAPTSSVDDASKTEQQKHEELVARIRKELEAQRARDHAGDALMARWEFAVCIGCGPSLRPYQRVWTNPVRVLAGIRASDDDKRQARLRATWTSLKVR